MPAFNLSRKQRVGIVLSVAAAMLLMQIPYPQPIRDALPNWVTLVLFYWCITLPRWVGIGYGWIIGLVMDVLQHTLFGHQALTKTLVAIIALLVYRRMEMYRMWQQCLVVLVVAAVEITVFVCLHRIFNAVEFRLAYWQVAITTALAWPLVYTALRVIR